MILLSNVESPVHNNPRMVVNTTADNKINGEVLRLIDIPDNGNINYETLRMNIRLFSINIAIVIAY